MNKNKLLLLLITLLSIHCLFNFGFRLWVRHNSRIQKKDDSFFQLKSTPKYLFIGDSHFQNGINPDFISESYNLATSSENYILNYYRLKEVLENTTTLPRTIFLSIGVHSFNQLHEELLLDRQLDDVYWSTKLDFIELVKRSGDYNYFKLGLKSYLFSYGGKYYQAFNLLSDEQSYSQPSKGFISSDKCIKSDINWNATSKNRVTYQVFARNNKSKLLQNYFKAIIELCTSKKIKLIIVKMPVSGPYLDALDKMHFDQENFWEMVSNLAPGIETWDYFHFFRKKSAYFADADHLNMKGAAVISKEISIRINNSLQNEVISKSEFKATNF